MTCSVSCIVEGHGEVRAVPELIRRLAAECGQWVTVRTPHRMTAHEMRTDRLSDVARIQAAAFGEGPGLLVVLFDADDDDPEVLRCNAEERLKDFPFVLGIAIREYEAWLLAASHKLAGANGFKDEIVIHPDPDSPRNAKKALEGCMTRSYKETIDQERITAQFDLKVAADRSPSFNIFREDLRSSLESIAEGSDQ